MPSREDQVARAADQIHRYAGVSQDRAVALVEAAVAAAQKEAFDLIVGDAPVPSSVIDTRALRLRYISDALAAEGARALTEAEVQSIFRVGRTTARTLLDRMRSTYPRSMDAFLRDQVRGSARAEFEGDLKKRRYLVRCDDESTFTSAQTLLQREGMTKDARIEEDERTLSLPLEMETYDGRNLDPLNVLGIERPGDA